MKAIFFKEIREHAVWAAIVFILLSICFAAVAYDGQHSIGELKLILINPRMTVATSSAFPMIGFSFGLLVVLQDYRIGRWAFLTHRPITRTRIFLGKFLAGSLLYLLATVPPLALTAWWVATPGHVAAPFDWQMLLPRLVDLAAGLVWLSAGMLVAARKAKWQGSRLFPAVVALISSWLAWRVWVFPDFADALGFLLAGFVILFPAAWGAFIFAGELETQPWPMRLLTTMSVATGVVALMSIIAAGIYATADAAWGNARWVYSYYLLSMDGQVLLSTVDLFGNQEFIDLEGHHVPASVRRSPIPDIYYLLRDSRTGKFQSETGLQTLESAYAQPIGGQNDLTLWYYVAHRRTIEGFDRDNREYIGSLGPDGFVPPSMPAKPFPDDLNLRNVDQGLIFTRTEAWLLQISANPWLKPLYTAAPDDPIVTAVKYPHSGAWTGNLNCIIVTPSSMHLFDSQGRELMHLPIDENFSNLFELQIAQPKEDLYMLLYDSLAPGDSINSELLVGFDGAGREIDRRTLPEPQRSDHAVQSWEKSVAMLAAPPPASLSLSFMKSEIPAWPYDLSYIAIGLASAIAAWILTRRYTITRAGRWFWTILAGLLGIGGVLLLICTRQAMGRPACPNCGRRRIVTRERCEHCDAPFSPPEARGIEVFEPA